MKKILPFIIIANVFLSGSGAILGEGTPTSINHTNQFDDNHLVIPISFPEYENDWIQSLPQGQQIRINGFNCLSSPGCPSLPVKNYLLALPPYATLLSINYEVHDMVQLPGKYQILPGTRPIPYDPQQIEQASLEKNIQIYKSDNAYPPEPVTLQNVEDHKE